MQYSDINIKVPDKLPFLEAICWQIKEIRNRFTLAEIFSLYERGHRYRGVLAELEGDELCFADELAKKADSVMTTMFGLTYHQKILTVLNALRSDFFTEISAYFGGGTLLTLLYDEYRLSKDIDFICPIGDGYRKLRTEIYDKGFQAMFQDTPIIRAASDIRADQYGIRFAVRVEDIRIKFEIIAEARITPDPPVFYAWSSIPCLSFTDCCAEKLLSNADRWADTAVLSRDLIDLSVLRLQAEIPQTSIDKAEAAYPVIKPLKKAIKFFQTRPEYRNRCFSTLMVRNTTSVLKGIALLAVDFGISDEFSE